MGEETEGQNAQEDAEQCREKVQKLEERGREYLDLLETAFEVFWEIDLEGKFVAVSPSIERLLGYRPDEIVGRCVFDLLWPGEEERIAQEFRTAVAARHPFRITKIYRHKDGTPVWMNCNGVPVFDAGGELVRYRGADTDITKQKTTEERLRESEELYRGLVETMNEGLVTMDPDGVITHVNRRLSEISGYSPHEIVGHTWSEFLKEAGKKRESVKRQIPQLWRRGHRVFELEWRGKDGKVHQSLVSSTSIRGARGERKGTLAVLMDISERKKTEANLKESEKTFRFLTSRLLAIQDRERKKTSQELHNSILQTISALKFNLENILEQRDDPFRALRSAVPLLQKSLEEIRRISLGLHPSILDDFGVLATVEWFLREYRTIYRDIQVHLEMEVQEQEIPETAKVSLFRVVQEAMSNVARHSRADRVSVKIGKRKGRIELAIRDNGVGFEPGTLSHDGEPAFVGLISTRERVGISGGAFKLSSEPGKGTEVHASWPIEPQI
jgi:PAS domain S-box-containing protein